MNPPRLSEEDPEIIPRLCEALFSRVEQKDGHERIYRLTVSYLEIYNERVRDLLKPTTSASRLRVREHPRLGPYVQGLSHHVVRTLGSLMSYVEEGAKARKTTSTLQNSTNSRSHALLTVALSQEVTNAEQHPSGSGTSSSRRHDATSRGGNRLHLIDLAGSESAATCDGVHRLKASANINKSLVALGNVISALTEGDPTGSGPSRRYIPYRDSSLTSLLKDALGGNATTIMLATISPASGSYNETAHALRLAQRAQSLVKRPVVNEDPVAKLIRELRDEVARLKSLLLDKDIDQQAKALCCCGKVQSSEDSTTGAQHREEQESLNTSQIEESDLKNDSVRSRDGTPLDVLSIRRFNSSDSVTTYETGSSSSIRKFSSYEQLQSPNRFINNYNQAEVTELNDEENEVVDEINEPVFVDIPTLVAVLIKPDDSLRESLTQIEEICSDELQEDSIDFIKGSNEEFDEVEKIDNVDSENRRNSINFCNVLEYSDNVNFHQASSECLPSSPAHVGRSKPRGKISKQNSVDLSSSNLDVSKKFGSIESISKRKEPILALQRSHTNLEKRQTLPDRGKKLNNIREVDDRKVNVKSGNIWKAIGNAGSKDHLQRKSSNDSDKSLKDSNSGKTSYNNIGRKPSLENLKRKTSKDSSSSSSKEEQISSSTRDKLLRRKSSLDQELASGVQHHTAIQRIKRAEIVAAVTERLYSSRKQTEEINMASNNVSDTRSPPESTDVKPPIISGFAARSKLQEISRKMLLKRRRINVETQTEGASTLRFKDTASLTDEPKVVLLDAAVLTDDHAACDIGVANHRLPVLRVKDVATLTDRPRTNILRCRDAESSANDLNFDDYELHSPRNDSGILSDDTQNYTESNLFNAEVFDLYPEGDRRAPCSDSSTNTFFSSPGRNSAVQTTVREEVVGQHKNVGCSQCCNLAHEINQRAPMSNPEKNVISISLPDMLNITIESTNALESRIAVMDGSDTMEEKPKSIFRDKESQTDEQARNKAEETFLSEDLSVRSTAVQADGRTFRIENIFQDTRSENNSDATSDPRKKIATKKSVTFRNSLGISSVIETKKSDMEMEWDKTYIPDPCQRKRQILRGSLTRAFIARKRSYSLSPRKPADKLIRHDLWKNWTLPSPEKSSYLVDSNIDKKIVDTFRPAQQNINLRLVNDLFATNNECIPIDKTLEERTHELSDQLTNFKDSEEPKSVSMKDLSDYDHNFSDDSLDYDEDNIAIKSTDTKIVDPQISTNYKNICPPDVVAHTKKEVLKSATHPAEVASLKDYEFENTEIEFPKRKPEISDTNSIHDYKSLILGSSSYVVDSDPEEETNVKALSLHDSINKKKVSFLNSSIPEDINNVLVNHKTLRLKQNTEVALKSIIKKIKKLDTAESLNIIQSNVEADQSLHTRKESMKSEEVLSASDENQNSEHLEELLDNKKTVFSNQKYTKGPCNEANTVVSNESSCAVLRRDILKEYLNETMIFMRNMNSINEYMNATNILESYGKRSKKRRDRQANYVSTNKDYIKYRGRKVSLKDDTDKYLRMDKEEVVPADFYEKCLRGIERLETCIDKVSEHNQVLRDRYGIDVESAGAKSSLASPSVDFRMSAVTKNNVIHQYRDAFAEDDVNESSTSETPLSFLFSPQDDIARQSSLHERETDESNSKIDRQNVDNKSNDITSEGDLERRIFDQLMDAADSRYRSLRKSRQRRPWRMFNPRLHSPTTTYSKFRETFRQDAHGILNFDEVHAVEDYLKDIRGIDNNSHDFRKTKLHGTTGDTESRITIESNVDLRGPCDRDKSPIENNSLLEINAPNDPTIFETKMKYPDCLIDPSNSIDVGRKFYEEDEIVRRSTRLKDCLKIDSMNHRSGGSLNMALKYPGSSRAKFLELLRERRRIVENSRDIPKIGKDTYNDQINYNYRNTLWMKRKL